jgi:hypothetical protein
LRISKQSRLSFLHLTALGGISFALLAVPSLARAAPNALCREAFLKNFFVEGTKDEFEGKDLCIEDSSRLPGKLQEAVRDAKEVHEKVAQTFGLRPEALFGEGVNLKIVAGVEGLNGTYKDESRQVELGTLSFPRRWIDRAMYAHELGHWVADSKSPLVPAYFRESRSSFLLDETLPDTVALATYGMAGMLDPELPACMFPRVINGKQTYKAPMDFFAARMGSRAIQNCCEANKGRLSQGAEGVCGFVAGILQKKPLPPLRPGLKFSARAALADLSQLDNHQIGVPVNSFLFALGEKLGRPVFQDFLRAAARARADSLACRIESDGKRAGDVNISITPFLNQLEAFHESLAVGDRALFQRMVKSFDLASAIAIDEDELGQRANNQGAEAIAAAMKANKSARLNQRHRCFKPLQDYLNAEEAEAPAACEVVCRPK